MCNKRECRLMDGRVSRLLKVVKEIRWRAVGFVLIILASLIHTFVSIIIKAISYV